MYCSRSASGTGGSTPLPAAEQALGERVQEPGQQAPPAEPGPLPQALEHVRLRGHAQDEGGVGEVLRGSALSVDADLVPRVRLQVDAQVRRVAVAPAHQVEDVPLGGEGGDLATLLAHEAGQLLRGAVVGEQAGRRGHDRFLHFPRQRLRLGRELRPAQRVVGLRRAGLGALQRSLSDLPPGSRRGDVLRRIPGPPLLPLHQRRGGVPEDGALPVPALQRRRQVEVQGLDPVGRRAHLDPAGGGGGDDGQREHRRQVRRRLGGLRLGEDERPQPAGELVDGERREVSRQRRRRRPPRLRRPPRTTRRIRRMPVPRLGGRLGAVRRTAPTIRRIRRRGAGARLGRVWGAVIRWPVRVIAGASRTLGEVEGRLGVRPPLAGAGVVQAAVVEASARRLDDGRAVLVGVAGQAAIEDVDRAVGLGLDHVPDVAALQHLVEAPGPPRPAVPPSTLPRAGAGGAEVAAKARSCSRVTSASAGPYSATAIRCGCRGVSSPLRTGVPISLVMRDGLQTVWSILTAAGAERVPEGLQAALEQGARLRVVRQRRQAVDQRPAVAGHAAVQRRRPAQLLREVGRDRVPHAQGGGQLLVRAAGLRRSGRVDVDQQVPVRRRVVVGRGRRREVLQAVVGPPQQLRGDGVEGRVPALRVARGPSTRRRARRPRRRRSSRRRRGPCAGGRRGSRRAAPRAGGSGAPARRRGRTGRPGACLRPSGCGTLSSSGILFAPVPARAGGEPVSGPAPRGVCAR